MPDPIRGVNPAIPIEVAQTGQPGGASPAPTPAGQTPVAGAVDTADVARAEALLATISTAAASVPAIDQARVAELQRAIESGAYQVKPDQVAEKIAQIEWLMRR